MKKIILEIIVDKDNEKWSSVFEEILVLLHKSYDDYIDKSFFWWDENIESVFSLEISKIWKKIGFYIISPKKYTKFLKNQLFSYFDDIEINEVSDYLQKIPSKKIIIWELWLEKNFIFPIKKIKKSDKDPYNLIIGTLSKWRNNCLNSIQINFSPAKNKIWKKNKENIIKIVTSQYPEFIKNILLNKNIIFLKVTFLPIIFIFKLLLNFIKIIFNKKLENIRWENIRWENIRWEDKNWNNSDNLVNKNSINDNKIKSEFDYKFTWNWFNTSINLIYAGDSLLEWKVMIKEILSTFSIYDYDKWNNFILKSMYSNLEKINFIKSRKIDVKNSFILNSSELSGLVHLPTNKVKSLNITSLNSKSIEPPINLPIITKKTSSNITPLWQTNFRGIKSNFWIETVDRRRHMYIIWKTGMWKSTLLENMIIDDIYKWRGLAVVDPHWDLAEAVIGFIPKNRTNQTIIFDPSDTNSPIGFNMLDNVDSENRSLVASWLVWVFKKIFWNSWGPRLEHILRNTILALIEYPNSTLISIPLMLTSEVFRYKVINKITDPVVRNFWKQEFAKMSPSQKSEASGPILNKVWQFLSSTILRNILWQSKNSFSIRWVMDNKKILIINLSKWKIWEDASALLGAMLVTKFQMDAMSRANIPEKERVDFYLYVDEFQNFATDSFSTILSEARKYKLNLVMANQYIDQMTKEVKWAIFWNVGSIVSFQVWYNDAKMLRWIYAWEISEEDLMNIRKYDIYSKILVDWMPTKTFLATTFPPEEKDNKKFKDRYEKILKVSREKYSKPRKQVEEKINKSLLDVEKEEKEWEEKKREKKLAK